MLIGKIKKYKYKYYIQYHKLEWSKAEEEISIPE
jgi:hypothetical protein